MKLKQIRNTDSQIEYLSYNKSVCVCTFVCWYVCDLPDFWTPVYLSHIICMLNTPRLHDRRENNIQEE